MNRKSIRIILFISLIFLLSSFTILNNLVNDKSSRTCFNSAVPQQELQSYSKYDFIPGDEIIFFDDFSDVAIGDFPLKWNTTASGEIVTLDNFEGKWFKMMEDYSYYSPEVQFVLPDNFTLEFEIIYADYHEWSLEFYKNPSPYIDDSYYPGDGGMGLNFLGEDIYLYNYNNLEDGEHRDVGKGVCRLIEPGEKVKYSIWGQNQRLRVYVDEKKVIDIPRAIPKNIDMNFMRFQLLTAMYMTNFRFAVGAPDTRSRLLNEGVFVTRGITFDSGSDKIKPESYAVLKEVAEALKSAPDVRVRIVGHTDSDGADESNLTLSQKRAESVKNALVNNFDIDASRFETDGKGESQPVSPNNTPEGKSNNRRVEFIKL